MTTELLFILPFLLVVFLGIIEFSMMLAAEARLAAAARDGARVAATGGRCDEIAQAVKNSLVKEKTLFRLFTNAEDPGTQNPGSVVCVKVDVNARDIIPNFLGYYGISISGKILSGQSCMRRE